MTKRKRLAGFLILALALAAGYAIFRPRPNLVPYMSPWLENEKEEVRISLLMPSGWEESLIVRGHVGESPQKWDLREVVLRPRGTLDWLPDWAQRWISPREDVDQNYLEVTAGAGGYDDTQDLKHRQMRWLESGIYIDYYRRNATDFTKTKDRILKSARIVGRRPLHRWGIRDGTLNQGLGFHI